MYLLYMYLPQMWGFQNQSINQSTNKHSKAVTTGYCFNNNLISIFWNLDL